MADRKVSILHFEQKCCRKHCFGGSEGQRVVAGQQECRLFLPGGEKAPRSWVALEKYVESERLRVQEEMQELL